MQSVVKRDGTIQAFNQQKITEAIEAAARASGTAVLCQVVSDKVCEQLGEQSTVEGIQDLVEEVLMESGYTNTAKAFILYREDRARARAARLHPDQSALADYIVASKYAREFDGRLETWPEIVDRVCEMHCKRWPLMEAHIRMLFTAVKERRVVPSMRSMQFGGPAIEAHNVRMFNCAFTHVNRPEVFAEVFYSLLAGCGVGFSVQRHHVARLPEVRRVDYRRVVHRAVKDTIEGWADALRWLLVAYTSTGEHIEFNYSGIRPEGAELRTSGGKAPGHLPLKRTLERVREVLDKAAERHLRPIECHDIMCYVAEGVLAGGIRRSSLISLFSLDDEEMMLAKSPENFEWEGLNGQRAMANNSAVCLRGETTEEDFRRLLQLSVSQYGEPGFYWTNSTEYGTNPCGEIGLNPGTGFAFCNLTEVNCAACPSEEELINAAGVAAAIGTLQAAYTDFKYLHSDMATKEALLGVGLTGMFDNELAFDPAVQQAMACRAVEMNELWACRLGINSAARVTTVKPSGTASLALGGVASGVHPHHAKRYFRRVTANVNEPMAQEFTRVNPHMVEVKPNGDLCLTFPVCGRGETVKKLSAREFLKRVFSTYTHWIVPGTIHTKLSPGLTHNVSCTVVVGEDEWEEVFNLVWDHQDQITAMSFLPRGRDDFPYMPRQEVISEEDEAKWNRLIKNYKPVDYHACAASRPSIISACGGGQCDI